jgi:PncC family amidohydrolase
MRSQKDIILDLSEKIIQELTTSKRSIMTAESCTAGLLGHSITLTPGSSAAYWGGVIVYDNTAKEQFLGVDASILEEFGAVSRATVEQMLDGIIKNYPVQAGIVISGVAGPGGGTVEKPVGLVIIGSIVSKPEPIKLIQKCLFGGGRVEIQTQAVIFGMRQLISIL